MSPEIHPHTARNVWDSVLLYDKEYRRKQSDESFEWGSYRQDLRDFQLVIKQITIQCMHFRKRQLEHPRTLDRRRMNVAKARFYLMAEKFVEALITILVSYNNTESHTFLAAKR
jgi:hypothetical protein